MDTGTFRYYTIQSNILSMLVAAVALIFEIWRVLGRAIPAWVYRLRFVSAIAITLTYLVFAVLLTPVMIRDGNATYLASAGNLMVHKAVPICAMLDWFLFGSVKKMKRRDIVWGLLPALCYVFFVYYCVGKNLTFSGNMVPYFFFDYTQYGWFRIGDGGLGVVYWIVILAGVLVGLGFLFMGIVRKREQRKK